MQDTLLTEYYFVPQHQVRKFPVSSTLSLSLPNMNSFSALRHLVKIAIFSAQACGFMPFRFDRQKKVLRRSRLHNAYAALFIGTIMAGTLGTMVWQYPETSTKWG